jgi:Terminase large subunit, T4likevirus-type, N-terminal
MLFGKVLRDPATWTAWRAFLCALFGLPMAPDLADTFRQRTGRATSPDKPFREAWLVCGRRAGKSYVLAMCAVFLAAFKNYGDRLAPGERATIMIIAADRKQARSIFRYVKGLLSIPMLAPLIEREASESIDLNNGVTIEIQTASYRSTRGYTLAAALCDELAFWRTDDSAEPDYAILDALRPGLGTIPGAMLLCASSPYAQSGALHDAYQRYFGKDDSDVLVWHAPTRTMNPTFPQATIDAAVERDPASASSEYMAEFRADIQGYITPEIVGACVSRNVFERAPISDVQYTAFVDPAGGSGSDSMTLAIGHREKDVAIVDCIRERKPPFSPDDAVQEFADVLRSYRVGAVHGDRYAGEWPAERFQKHGITYIASKYPKSNTYLGTLPALNSKRVDLLDHKRMLAQFVGLERRSGSGGRDSIDHRVGGQDDVANSVAGVIWELVRQPEPRKKFPNPIIISKPANWPDYCAAMGGGSWGNPAVASEYERSRWPII